MQTEVSPLASAEIEISFIHTPSAEQIVISAPVLSAVSLFSLGKLPRRT